MRKFHLPIAPNQSHQRRPCRWRFFVFQWLCESPTKYLEAELPAQNLNFLRRQSSVRKVRVRLARCVPPKIFLPLWRIAYNLRGKFFLHRARGIVWYEIPNTDALQKFCTSLAGKFFLAAREFLWRQARSYMVRSSANRHESHAELKQFAENLLQSIWGKDNFCRPWGWYCSADDIFLSSCIPKSTLRLRWQLQSSRSRQFLQP